MVLSTGRLWFGPDNGRMLVRTGRAGVGSAAGHDLTIEVTAWSVRVDIPENGPADAAVTARIDLRSLAVREARGGAMALTDKDIGEIEENARRTLDLGRHPTATFESSRVVMGDNHAMISGMLTLHGVTAPVDVPLREVAPDRYRGATVVTQSAYGIKPYSAFLGALKVRDDVEVEIEVNLGPRYARPGEGSRAREPRRLDQKGGGSSWSLGVGGVGSGAVWGFGGVGGVV